MKSGLRLLQFVEDQRFWSGQQNAAHSIQKENNNGVFS